MMLQSHQFLIQMNWPPPSAPTTHYTTATQSLLATSSGLVHRSEQADRYDRLVIFLALDIVFLAVAFILKRRVLDDVVRGVGCSVVDRGRWTQSPKQVVKDGGGIKTVKSGKDRVPTVTRAAVRNIEPDETNWSVLYDNVKSQDLRAFDI
jgi:hypothetical protein